MRAGEWRRKITEFDTAVGLSNNHAVETAYLLRLSCSSISIVDQKDDLLDVRVR